MAQNVNCPPTISSVLLPHEQVPALVGDNNMPSYNFFSFPLDTAAVGGLYLIQVGSVSGGGFQKSLLNREELVGIYILCFVLLFLPAWNADVKLEAMQPSYNHKAMSTKTRVCLILEKAGVQR